MAMPTRSARDTAAEWAARSTPSVVGPGTYAPKKLSPAAAAAQPNFAAFASSAARRLAVGGTTADTPGPGSYVAVRGVSRAAANANIFRSNVDRIAPCAPGSSVFLAASSATSPGPGSYAAADAFRFKPAPKAPRPTRPGAAQQHFNPPTIPRREQAHGYYEDADGRCRPLPPGAGGATYTGLGADTIGPNRYELPTALRTDGTRFALSGTQRVVFGAGEAPGPGSYDIQPAEAALRRSAAHSADGSSAFQSRVKMAHETSSQHAVTGYAGPGHYPVAPRQPEWPSVLQCFGATSAREGWHRPGAMPYSDPSSVGNPGPGTYAAAAPSAFRREMQKRLTDDPLAFSSTEERPCLAAGERRPAPTRGSRSAPPNAPRPGPGEYDLSRQSCAAAVARRTVGRHGIFGSCSARFHRAGLDVGTPSYEAAPNAPEQRWQIMATVDEAPSPESRRRRPAPGTRAQGSSGFTSTVERFAGQMDPRSPDHVLIGRSREPAPAHYDLASQFEPRKPEGPSAALASKTARFLGGPLSDGAAPDGPGPGAYRPRHNADWRKRRPAHPTQPREQRFREVDPATASDVGPGTYIPVQSFVSRSFNVTYSEAHAAKANP
ncbi:hypothetical protein M885DRAFT_549418 [Pelagophyceae sp. CCMP2097]|nr:hypothetical protein M885DRAFT_549418 [Pelagophyceae sp. CCMP2097]